MKAAQINAYGSEINIAEAPMSELAPDSVLVEVHAASVNPLDNYIRTGFMQEIMPVAFPFTLGSDLSGVVVETGADVTNFKAGDAVFARSGNAGSGAMAEFAVVAAQELALKPASLSHAEAAAMPMVALTAWQALVGAGNVKKGQKVLIQAGSGGVGSMAIQIARHLGAYVATTTSADNTDMVIRLGADQVIDYQSEKFEEVLSGFDMVLDVLGGETLNNGFKVLKKGGAMVSLMGPDEAGLAEKYGVAFTQLFSAPDGAMLAKLARLADDGVLRPVVERRFEFADIQAAFDHIQSGRAKGKLVIDIK